MAVYDGVVEAFALRLASNNTREEEFLGKTRITTAIAKSIAKSLAKNTTLKRFGLYNNNLSVDGICAIVTALGDNSTIEEFHLWRNSTGHRGAMALAETLKRNTTLRVVTLSCNDILVKGSRAIAQALEKNTTLVEIGLGGNEIDFKSFARSLKTNTSLRAINLSGNVFAGIGSSKVAKAFGTDEESEQPAYSNIGTDGARALLSALRVNTTVTNPLLVPRTPPHAGSLVCKTLDPWIMGPERCILCTQSLAPPSSAKCDQPPGLREYTTPLAGHFPLHILHRPGRRHHLQGAARQHDAHAPARKVHRCRDDCSSGAGTS